MDIVIKCTKSILVISEQELFQHLPRDVLLKALSRGKGYKRMQRVCKYEKSRAEYEAEDIHGRDSPKKI